MQLRSRAIAGDGGSSKASPSKEQRRRSAAPSSSTGLARIGKLVFLVLGIWTCFIYWGILQQRVTSSAYERADGSGKDKWTYMVVANMFMGATAAMIGGVAYTVHARFGGTSASPFLFWRAAASNTVASPIGYLGVTSGLISFPLSLLVKNCKLVPVMVVGSIVNKIRYTPQEYLAVLLISAGVPIFMMKPAASHAGGGLGAAQEVGCAQLVEEAAGKGASLFDWAGVVVGCAAVLGHRAWSVVSSSISLKELAGVGLAATNLVIDGFTNAEQDRLNRQHHPSPFWMMACVNVWGVLFALAYLLGGLAMYGPESQLSHAYSFFVTHPTIQRDLLHFCLANAFGQVFIFSTIKEFGPLVSVTVAITRKSITLALSIVSGDDPVYWWHWLGVSLVVAGVAISAVPNKSKRH